MKWVGEADQVTGGWRSWAEGKRWNENTTGHLAPAGNISILTSKAEEEVFPPSPKYSSGCVLQRFHAPPQPTQEPGGCIHCKDFAALSIIWGGGAERDPGCIRKIPGAHKPRHPLCPADCAAVFPVCNFSRPKTRNIFPLKKTHGTSLNRCFPLFRVASPYRNLI